jgi:hypothetical protein
MLRRCVFCKTESDHLKGIYNARCLGEMFRLINWFLVKHWCLYRLDRCLTKHLFYTNKHQCLAKCLIYFSKHPSKHSHCTWPKWAKLRQPSIAYLRQPSCACLLSGKVATVPSEVGKTLHIQEVYFELCIFPPVCGPC